MTNMTGDTPLTLDADALLESYEELRTEAMRPTHSCHRGCGLALFVGRGMAVWLSACVPVARLAGLRRPTTATAVPADLRTEVAMLLAEMVRTSAHFQGGVK